MKRKVAIVLALLTFSTLLSCADQAVRAKHLRFQGNTICYEMRGRWARTLVLIHGWTGSTKSWKYQIDAFSRYRVIAVHLPGNGKSSKKENSDYRPEFFADGVCELLKKEKIRDAFFIGHSMGFTVAEVIAVKYPDMCRGIAGIDGVHFELPEDPEEKEAWIRFNREFAASMEAEKGREDFLNALFLPDTPDILKKEVLTISREVPLAIGKAMIEGVEKDQKYWKKREMLIPCLTIFSPVFRQTPKDKADFIRMYPRVEYHDVADVSHFFMLEMPYKTNQIITDYLSREYR